VIIEMIERNQLYEFKEIKLDHFPHNQHNHNKMLNGYELSAVLVIKLVI